MMLTPHPFASCSLQSTLQTPELMNESRSTTMPAASGRACKMANSVIGILSKNEFQCRFISTIGIGLDTPAFSSLGYLAWVTF